MSDSYRHIETVYSAYNASVVSVTVKGQSDHRRVCQAKTLMPIWTSLDLYKNSHATLYIQGSVPDNLESSLNCGPKQQLLLGHK